MFKQLFVFFLGLTAKVIDRTKTMADVYGAFYDFSCMLKTKVSHLFLFLLNVSFLKL